MIARVHPSAPRLSIRRSYHGRLACTSLQRYFAIHRLPPPSSQSLVTRLWSLRSCQYAALAPRRELPTLKRKWPFFLALCATGLSAWAAFLYSVVNQEKANSSVVLAVLRTVQKSSEIQNLLGENIRPEPVWWQNGNPWISGKVQMLRGDVDIKVRLRGDNGAGTLYFTSVRKNTGEPFTILRFKLIADDEREAHVPITEVDVVERKL